MAALPYLKLYVGDYMADTMNLLTAEEHGAYLLLIMHYWRSGGPIPKDKLPRVARVPNERWTHVEQALNEFFIEENGCWKHERIEVDLEEAKQSVEKNKRAGKASAEARSSKKQQTNNERSTSVQHPFNERSTGVEQVSNPSESQSESDTPSLRSGEGARKAHDTQPEKQEAGKPAKTPRAKAVKPGDLIECLPGLSEDVAQDYIDHRKGKGSRLTRTAWKPIAAEVAKCDDTPDVCLAEAMAAGWQGFKAEWYANRKRTGQQSQGGPRHRERDFSQIDYHAGINANGSF